MSTKNDQSSKDEAQQAPHRGLIVDGRSALASDTIPTSKTDEHSSPPRNLAERNQRCGGKRQNGTPCTQRAVLLTAKGYFCRKHRPEDAVTTNDLTLKPPVAVIRNKADADKYVAWLIKVGSSGHKSMKASMVSALLKVVSAWNRQQQRLEDQLYKDFGANLAKLREARRLYDEARDSIEQNHNAHRAEEIAERADRTAREALEWVKQRSGPRDA